MGPNSSLLCLQEPTTCLFSETHPPILLFKVYFNILSSTPRTSKWFFPSSFPTKTLYISLISHVCWVLCPSQLHSFDYLNNIWQWVQIIKFFMMQVSPSCCYFHPLSTKYLLHHLVLEHLLPVCKIAVPCIMFLCFYMANGKARKILDWIVILSKKLEGKK